MKRYVFKPSWLHITLLVLFFPTFIALGVWQLHRAEFKQQILSEYKARLQQPPLNLNDKIVLGPQLRYALVKLQGYFDNHHTILLDNQFQNHKTGYYVLSPFILLPSHQVVLVNRGWVEAINREQIPAIPPIIGNKNVLGRIYWPDKPGFVLNNTPEALKNGLLRVQKVDFPQLNGILRYNFLPFVVLLDPNAPFGFAREWDPVRMPMPPAMHRGYAVQWFAMAGVLLIVVIIVSIKRTREYER